MKVPDFPEGKAPDTSFAELKNPKAFISDAFSICFWVSVTFEHHAEILSRAEKSGLVITFLSHGNYVDLGEHSVRFQIPDKFDFLPEKWIFLCLSYKKILKVYLNSVLIFDQNMENHSMSFKLDENFLKHIQLGKASNFAGELSQLNIWSKVLDKEDINTLYKCQDVSDNPDLVDWRTEELKQGPNVTIVDFPHNICFLAKDIDDNKNHIVYNIHSLMVPHRKALRLCKSLGGAAPSFEAEFEKLQTNIRYIPSTCKSTWLPIFKSSNLSELWIGENSEFTHQLASWPA